MKYDKEEIIKIIKQIASKNNSNYLSYKDFYSSTKIGTKIICKYFSSWNNAVKEAGLQPLNKSGKPDIIKGFTREEIINKIRETAKKLGKKTLKMKEFYIETNISDRPIFRLFQNWHEALLSAGLEKSDNYNLKIGDNELFDDYINITKKNKSSSNLF